MKRSMMWGVMWKPAGEKESSIQFTTDDKDYAYGLAEEHGGRVVRVAVYERER